MLDATTQFTTEQLAGSMEAAGWFARADLIPNWPLSMSQAVELLRDGAEYAVDHDRLCDLIDRGFIAGAIQWEPQDVVNAAGQLELMRMWKATPSIHDPKKHPTLLALEQHGAKNVVLQPDPPLRYLLILMVQSDHREMREKLLSTITAVLNRDYGVEL